MVEGHFGYDLRKMNGSKKWGKLGWDLTENQQNQFWVVVSGDK